MPAERLAMRKIREVLRLRWSCRMRGRRTALACGIARSTVREYEERALRAGISSWDQVESLDDVELEGRLFPAPVTRGAYRPLPEWGWVHGELQKSNVTRQLVWQEYKECEPGGLEYSRFCELYREFVGRLDLSLRQVHKAGERMFVDYCGQTLGVRDAKTGAVRQAQIFVAVLGASNYTYAEATWTQQLVEWIGSHERAWNYFGGVTEVVVPDNLKSGVNKACRYEPSLNPTYQDLAMHYGVAVLPARVGKPKDKAKVEVGVQVVQRWILARLRNREFFSLAELNAAIQELLERLNTRPFRKLEGTRRSRFLALDQPALRPLPQQRFEYAEWSTVRVGRDYHVLYEGHYYSVPYELVGKQLDVRVTEHGVECLHRSRRVACHRRSHEVGSKTTLLEHMPKAHREYTDRSPERLLAWAATVGESTAQVSALLLANERHWRQGFQAAEGLRPLGKRHGPERLEAACARALKIRSVSYTSVKSILSSGQDRVPLPPSEPREGPPPGVACYVADARGPIYYSGSAPASVGHGEDRP